MKTAKDIINSTNGTSEFVLNLYLQDLSDADLLVPPAPGLNPIAWQLGHLISSEFDSLAKLDPSLPSPLPKGFAEAHNKEAAGSGDLKGYLTKDQYLELGKKVRALANELIARTPDSDMGAPSGLDYAPTKGELFNMIGSHVLMHVGQIVALRRKLGKPVVM
jgi:hypothetical protein